MTVETKPAIGDVFVQWAEVEIKKNHSRYPILTIVKFTVTNTDEWDEGIVTVDKSVYRFKSPQDFSLETIKKNHKVLARLLKQDWLPKEFISGALENYLKEYTRYHEKVARQTKERAARHEKFINLDFNKIENIIKG